MELNLIKMMSYLCTMSYGTSEIEIDDVKIYFYSDEYESRMSVCSLDSNNLYRITLYDKKLVINPYQRNEIRIEKDELAEIKNLEDIEIILKYGRSILDEKIIDERYKQIDYKKVSDYLKDYQI